MIAHRRDDGQEQDWKNTAFMWRDYVSRLLKS